MCVDYIGWDNWKDSDFSVCTEPCKALKKGKGWIWEGEKEWSCTGIWEIFTCSPMGAFLSHARCDSSPDYEMPRYALGILASGEAEKKMSNGIFYSSLVR